MRRLALVLALLGGAATIYWMKAQKPVGESSKAFALEDLDSMPTPQLVKIILQHGQGEISSRAIDLIANRYIGEINLQDLERRGRWQDDDTQWAH